jgi:parallel beta-helix repeat protein
LPEDCDDYGIWNGLTSTCILAQNLTESVEITTNNVTLNCNGHSITGTGTGYGIYLNSREDVIVQNCTVINFSVGIPLLFASDNTIITSTMSDNHYSIVLAGSFSNTLTDNNALNNWVGIMLNPSSNANNLTNNDASNNLGFGILLQVNSDNILTNNTALNNNVGIHLYRSSGNTLKNNIMSANTYNFGVSGVNLSDYIQDIDISNKVNGKPVYYWVGQQNRQVPTLLVLLLKI